MYQFADFPDSRDTHLAESPISAAPTNGIYRNGFKRILDILLALTLLPVALPMMAILALIVARDGHNPFYLQPRIGRGGKVFTLIKLRTMVPDAESLLAKHLGHSPEAADEWRCKQKLMDDPRITPFGALLRRLSVDEVPQIWNVMCGHMSFVGPRPMMLDQQRLYPGKDYYNLRPGITGLWQVSERHGSEFVSRAKYDRAYALSLSLFTDFRVLVRTVIVVLRATGI